MVNSDIVKEQTQTAKFLRILFQPSNYAIYGDIREGYVDLLTALPSLRSDSIAELGPLEHLGGELYIWNLENVTDPSHATGANLEGKKNIEKLKLWWRDDDRVHNSSIPEQILEQLRPSSYLKALEVHNYPGVRFPNWLGENCLSKLTSLYLHRGRHCSELPALGQLELLKELRIEHFDSIVSIGPEFYGINSSNKKAFLSLEKLTFSIMPSLKQLTPPPILDDDGQVRAFPLLQELFMKHCMVLETVVPILPHYPLPSLTLLENVSPPFFNDGIHFRLSKLSTGLYRVECGGYASDLNILLERIESTMCLEELDIFSCPEIRSFQLRRFKDLSSLDVSKCPIFEYLYCGDEEGPLTCLRSLRIHECSNFISFPGQGFLAPGLRKLSLENLDALEELPNHMHSLLPSLTDLRLSDCTKLRSFPEGGLPSSIEKLEISFCDEIESSPEGGFPSSLKELEIRGCGKLVADRKNWGLQALQSLSSLDISACEEVLESFPEETLLPSSLNSLRLDGFRHLKSLDYKGLEHLSSLKKLKLYFCPQLQSLPEEGLPSSLQCLKLSFCHKTLEERCKNGREWKLISHIPRIRIDCWEI
ncbi:hypothetical protein Tsubulata_013238 [Turnera subulata]|uniref:R13L1/DRL21-like LRR repeat region domain-containing protein n=1 Tax=Turnera subulata TaxID=218843 RepID=A0A9Q0FBK3_9ROSI|nr:hypothetical protein Tsubulata_013238 [Turnera subulata]